MKNLVNIYSHKRKIYLFCRDEKGKQNIEIIDSFFPYFYMPNNTGNYTSFDGKKLKRIMASDPSSVIKNRKADSYEADIPFIKRYLIDKVDHIEKTKIKYCFLDIEIQADEMPNPKKASQPISCISIYNSFSKIVKTFFIKNYETEYNMIEDFITYMKKEAFDLILGWNLVQFDYTYLFNRIPDFAKRISPIDKSRYGGEDLLYPAGIGILDYLELFKKITLNREKSYKLDEIAQVHLGEESCGKFDFGEITEEIKIKNINDVKRLAKLEEKFQIISYCDEIRRLSKIVWEDLYFNSRIIDMLLLQEARKQKIILPMKPKDNEKEEYLGAYRQCFSPGAHFGVGSYDLSSCYPSMVMDFCLDPSNINDDKGILINGNKFEQNPNALLPIVTKKLLTLKDNIKKELGNLDINSIQYKDTLVKYKAIKGLANSAYGVFGNRFFRLYNKQIAETITFLVRDLLHYVENRLKEKNYKILYIDTDGIMIDNNTENIADFLNDLVKQWAKDKYNKNSITTEFGYEGKFTKLLLLAKCRYLGYLETSKGIEKKTVGIEAKRKDSTIFMKKLQEKIINYILNKLSKEDVINAILVAKKEIKEAPLQEIAFPCKLARKPEDYKNVPIFVRALNNTPELSKKVGSPFYYMYINPTEYEIKEEHITMLDKEKLTGNRLKKEWELYFKEKKNVKDMPPKEKEELMVYLNSQGRISVETVEARGKPKDVMGFDEENHKHIKREMINWDRIIERNIMNKCDVIFKAMGWDIGDIK